MFERKLKALDYMYYDKFNGTDEKHFRKLVVWLEDQKIRHYTIEDRCHLRLINNEKWNDTFNKYTEDLGCPINTNNLDKLEWLVGLAVRLEFEDNLPKYQVKKEIINEADIIPSAVSKNPLDNLNFDDNDFKNGVTNLSKLLNIPQHPDHLVTLEACRNYITQRLNSAAIKNPSSVIVKGKPFPIVEESSKDKKEDKVMKHTVAALDLLYIQDLRNLQTMINEAIVAVQNITADPKTDTKAGKVGV